MSKDIIIFLHYLIEFRLLGVRKIDKRTHERCSFTSFPNSLLRLLVAEKNSTHQSSRLNILTKEELAMGWIWSLIVGAIIGIIAGGITKKGESMGWIANIIAGLVGSSIGQAIFGHWGPSLAGMALIPSVLGAVILVAVVSFFISNK